MNNGIWQKLQSIEPRFLYVVLLVIIAAPMLFPGLALPIVPGQQSKDAYETIQKIGKENPPQLVLLDGVWSASTRGESQWQTQAIMLQLMRDHIPFATMSADPQNPQLMENIADPLAKKYGYVYGRDFVNFGFQVAYVQTLKGIVNDIKGTIKVDWNGKPLSQFPVLAHVNSIKDIGAVVEITPASSLDSWLGLVTQIYHTPLIYVPTAVMAPEGYPFRDSGQVAGILVGVKGAGDYEKLMGVKMEGTQVSTALSMVYALIIILVVVGNIGYHGGRLADKNAARREKAQ